MNTLSSAKFARDDARKKAKEDVRGNAEKSVQKKTKVNRTLKGKLMRIIANTQTKCSGPPPNSLEDPPTLEECR